MARVFAPITKKELEKKIGEHDEYVPKDLTVQVKKDLSKIEFDTENWDTGYFHSWEKLPKGVKTLGGYHTLDNGFTFYGCMAGGDWESPVFFIIYWDGKKLRGYLPTDGNVYNTITKEALGNDDRADIKYLCKRLGEKYSDGADYQDFLQNHQFCQKFDYGKVVADIQKRILPSSSMPKPKPRAKTINVKTCNVSKAVESLTFYSCVDESYELWSSMCSLCYRLYGFGNIDRARVVLKWIIEDAKESKKWTIGEFGSLDEVDSAKGVWGK